MKKFILLAVSLCCFIHAAENIDFWTPPEKKLIECGWSQAMNGTRLRNMIKNIEATSPCQGVSIRLAGVDDKGKKFSTTPMFGTRTEKPKRWKYEYFKNDRLALKSIKFNKFTDNFFATTSNYGNVDWFSDEDWDIVCNNFGLLARIAREVGFKGIIFDGEWYHTKSKPFFYDHPAGRTSEEMQRIIRKRGREWAKAIFSNFPEAKILFFMGISGTEATRMIPEAGSMRVAFFNGIYDALPPTGTILEGHEHHAYGAANETDYANLRVDMWETFMRLIDRKNITKYKLQTQLAPAIYLDPYLDPKARTTTFLKHLKPVFAKSPNLTVFRRNLHRAFNVADEYVWIWSEKGRWYTKRRAHPGSKMIWEKVHPGVTRTAESARDPLAYAKRVLAEKKLVNLAKDPEMKWKLVKPYRSDSYSFWAKKCKEAKFAPAPGAGKGGRNAFRISGSRRMFTVTQGLQVKGDELYYIRMRMKIESGKSAKYGMLVAFADALKRDGWQRTVQCARFGKPDKEGWRIAEIAVIVPENMRAMQMRFLGDRQQDDDVVLYDSLEVYKIDSGYYVK